MAQAAPIDTLTAITALQTDSTGDSIAVFGMVPAHTRKPSELKLSDYGFFAGSKYFHPEQGFDRSGVAGDPAPYNAANDNAITGLLLLVFVMMILFVSSTRDFIARQTRTFFNPPRRMANVSETTSEVRMQLFLVMQTALLGGIIYYMYAREVLGSSFIIDSPLAMIGIFFGVLAVYFLLKATLYGCVNWVFFDKKSRSIWWKAWLYLTALEGVVLFPLVLLLVYFGLESNIWLTALLIVIGIAKLLTFYKAYHIFFKQTRLYFQFFLYLCALELMPLATLLGALAMTGRTLQL